MRAKISISDIFPLIRTQEEAALALREIDIILESLFKKRRQNFLAKNLRAATFANISKILSKRPGRQLLELSLSRMSNELTNRERLEITLAIEPTEDLVQTIYDWAVEKLGDNVLLQFDKDPRIVGGLIFSYKGIFKDLSLAAQIDKIIRKQ